MSALLRTALIALMLALLVAACGTAGSHRGPATSLQPMEAGPWPSAADYGTLRTAVAVRDDALFRQADWRRKSYSALLAAKTLLTVRLGPGRCASYVTELYGNLRDLMDAYPGENWLPLVRTVRHQSSLAAACRQPTLRLGA